LLWSRSGADVDIVVVVVVNLDGDGDVEVDATLDDLRLHRIATAALSSTKRWYRSARQGCSSKVMSTNTAEGSSVAIATREVDATLDDLRLHPIATAKLHSSRRRR
jgi:hypothetical protein